MCFFDGHMGDGGAMVMERCVQQLQQQQQSDLVLRAQITAVSGGATADVAAVGVWPGGGGVCLLLEHHR